jgi:hypothetical protein
MRRIEIARKFDPKIDPAIHFLREISNIPIDFQQDG